MPDSTPRPLLPGPPRSVADRAATWLRTAFLGRLLVVGVLLKIAGALLGLAAADPPPWWLRAIDVAGSLATLSVGVWLLWRAIGWTRRRLLWRVRRKLILSYVFVGLVPSLLIGAFFLIAGLLLARNIAGYLVQTRLRSEAQQARFLAETVLLDVQRAATAEAVRDTLDRQLANSAARYPHLSIALVRVRNLRCGEALVAPNAARVPPITLPATAGEWAHTDAPGDLPAWVPCDGAAGVLAYDAAADGAPADIRLAARAVALPATRTPSWAVVLDIPVAADLEGRIRTETGIQLGDIAEFGDDEAPPITQRGRGLDPRPTIDAGEGLIGQLLRRWVVVVERFDWASGRTGSLRVMLTMQLVDIYRRIAFESGLGSVFNGFLLGLLVVIGVLFLVIQGVALLLGLTLARQITGAVHDLFTGTEHLRNRDFSHVIPVRARDQLGELADSFNVMTSEITRLLVDVAQKERLEQEFATAREIQMKLLPHGPLIAPGLAVSAYCEPAREVGGDYYDMLPIGEDMVGFLIADVSGKGVGAGLYMAQLKGLVLSLARLHTSPRDFLIAVNRVLVDHLDGRSFITMSYVVVDLRRRVMTYARAGHCPMILVPAAREGVQLPVKVLAPDGLVVGLTIDDGTLFESLLEEVTVPLAPGDLVVLYTDGMTEMMNPAHDCFGEDRLGELAGRHRAMPLDALASELVSEVRAFAAGAGQHDDMTMLLLRVDPRPAGDGVAAAMAMAEA